MTNRLDHLMYAGADLDGFIAEFAAMSGVTADRGGSHPGMGTRNALASLGGDIYLELIAPDPEQPLDGTYGGIFATFERPQIYMYIVKGQDLEALQATMADFGVESDLIDASRSTPDGDLLRWRLLIPRENRFKNFAPNFIDWMDTPHPSITSVQGCTYDSFEIGHPEAEDFAALLRAVDSDIVVHRADRPYFLARISTPKGQVVITGM